MITKEIEGLTKEVIADVLLVAEGAFGDHPRWQLFRRQLLKKLNDMKRAILADQHANQINKQY